jgi:hypothetical protein
MIYFQIKRIKFSMRLSSRLAKICFLYFIIISVFIGQYTCKETQLIELQHFCAVASYCNGEPCSQYGNCYIDIFQYYNKSNPNTDSSCICNSGWISTDDQDVRCCYSQKLQWIAFFLEFALGFGCGHFYLQKYLLGTIKFCSCLILCCIGCFSGFLSCCKEEDEGDGESPTIKTNPISSYLIYSSFILYFALQLVDSVLFGINFYVDGQGYKMLQW